MNNLCRSVATLACLSLLAACGGEDGVMSPPPAPSIPVPPVPVPPLVPLVAVGASTMLADLRFYPGGFNPFANDQYSVPTDRTGRYPGSTLLPLNGVGVRSPDYAIHEKSAAGLDTAGPFYVFAQAPADAVIISPLTHLIRSGSTEARLEIQLGISGSLFGLQADRDLRTFSATDAVASTDAAVAADGERLFAHHLRVHLLTAALNSFGPREQNPVGFDTFLPWQTHTPGPGLGTCLASAPVSFIYTNQNMVALLRCFPGIANGSYGDDVLSAAAHLINAYAAAIPVRISSRAQAARFMIGIKGYLVPELTRLLRINDATAAARVLAITSTEVLAQTARYAEQLPFDVNDSFFTVPDFYTLPQGGSKLVDATDIGFNGDGPFTDNDMHLRASDGATPFQPGGSSITAVSVPAANAGEVSAMLNPDGTVLIQAVGGFTGATYFDYTAQHPRGDVEQGRVYVRVTN